MSKIDNLRASGSTSFRSGATEILQSFLLAPLWSTLAWNDIELRYRRTTVGPIWITLGLGVTVFSVGLLYAGIFGNDPSQYLPYFAAGLVAWTFLGTTADEGCGALLSAAAIIKAIPVAPAVHILRMMTRQLIMLAHNLIIIVILWFIFQWQLTSNCLLVIPGLLLNCLTLFGASLALSVVAARFRDVRLIISTVLQLVFLLTPVIWETKSLRGSAVAIVADLNPFYQLIEVVRRPILGEAPALVSWIYCSALAAISMTLGLYFYSRYRHRVAYWV